VAVDKIIDVVTMGNGRMTAVRAMDVSGVVSRALMSRGTVGGVRRRHFDLALIVVSIVGLMQVAVVQIVDVVAMGDGDVSTVGAVLMIVLGVSLAGHSSNSFWNA
jgi:hypothetical protein